MGCPCLLLSKLDKRVFRDLLAVGIIPAIKRMAGPGRNRQVSNRLVIGANHVSRGQRVSAGNIQIDSYCLGLPSRIHSGILHQLAEVGSLELALGILQVEVPAQEVIAGTGGDREITDRIIRSIINNIPRCRLLQRAGRRIKRQFNADWLIPCVEGNGRFRFIIPYADNCVSRYDCISSDFFSLRRAQLAVLSIPTIKDIAGQFGSRQLPNRLTIRDSHRLIIGELAAMGLQRQRIGTWSPVGIEGDCLQVLRVDIG